MEMSEARVRNQSLKRQIEGEPIADDGEGTRAKGGRSSRIGTLADASQDKLGSCWYDLPANFSAAECCRVNVEVSQSRKDCALLIQGQLNGCSVSSGRSQTTYIS
jgi:hypothetical protein